MDDTNACRTDAVTSDTKPLHESPKSLKRKRGVSALGDAGSADSKSDDRPDRYKRVLVYCKSPDRYGRSGSLKWKCEYPKCNGAFPTRSVLAYHANTHASNKSHTNPVSVSDLRKDRGVPQLSAILAQHDESYFRGRRRRIPASKRKENPACSERQHEELLSTKEPTNLAADVPKDEDSCSVRKRQNATTTVVQRNQRNLGPLYNATASSQPL